MSTSQTPLPLKRSDVIELYFMEHRAKLIDIAAFLDRVDRANDDVGGSRGGGDFRMNAFRDALTILSDNKSQRAKRVLELLSDPTSEPIDKAPMKGALGAYSKAARH